MFGERRRIELSRFLTQRNEIYSTPVMVTGRLRFQPEGQFFGEKQRFFAHFDGYRWEMQGELGLPDAGMSHADDPPLGTSVRHDRSPISRP